MRPIIQHIGLSPTAKRWVAVLFGFGISAPVALIPLFGKLGVPPFQGLLNLIPLSIQPIVIPLSCAAITLSAISAEFRVMERESRTKLLADARTGLYLAAALLLAFCLTNGFLVTTVHLFGGKETLSFVTGWRDPSAQPCAGMGSEDCIKNLTVSESVIASYFGDKPIRVSKAIIEIVYVCFFAALGNLAGILVTLQLRQKPVRVAAGRPRKARAG